jgi:hypothetical protein
VPGGVLALVLLCACGTGSGEPGGPPTSGEPTAGSTSSPVDLTGVDACTLLDEATVQQVTGESVRFATRGLGMGNELRCFWGAAVPNVSAYPELPAARRSTGLSSCTFPAGCMVIGVNGVGSEAKGATCPGDPHLKVWLVALDQGISVTVLVNEPGRALAPGDLAATLEAVVAKLQ